MAALACLALFQSAQAQPDPFLDRETVTKSFYFPTTANMDLAEGTVSCPSEAVLITGGAWILAGNNGIPPYIALMANRPKSEGWYALAREMSNSETATRGTSLLVSAVCGYLNRSASAHIEVVTASYALTRTTNMDLVSGTATCPAGKTAISGGAQVLADNGSLPESVVLMTSKVQGNGWYALAREIASSPTGIATRLHVSAVCADAASGISDLQTVSATSTMVDNDTYMDISEATAACPAGKSSIGGGAEILASNNGIPPYVTLMTSQPSGANGWYVLGRETQAIDRGTLTVKVTATANCATLSSGVTGLEVVTRKVSIPNQVGAMDALTEMAYCPSGKTMIGGGAKIIASNNGIPPYVALLASSPSANGWKAVARETQDNTLSSPNQLWVSAVCAVLPQ